MCVGGSVSEVLAEDKTREITVLAFLDSSKSHLGNAIEAPGSTVACLSLPFVES